MFTVPVTGGTPRRLTWHPGHDVAQGFTPDGRAVLFASTRAGFKSYQVPPQFLQWKQYRGGMVAQIWLYTSKGHAVEKIPQPASRANDTDPIGPTRNQRISKGSSVAARIRES